MITEIIGRNSVQNVPQILRRDRKGEMTPHSGGEECAVLEVGHFLPQLKRQPVRHK